MPQPYKKGAARKFSVRRRLRRQYLAKAAREHRKFDHRGRGAKPRQPPVPETYLRTQ